MLRDIDMINHTANEMQLLMNKCHFYAQQVQDPVIRHLLQDAARVHQRHLSMLSTARSQLQQQLGAAQPSPQQLLGVQPQQAGGQAQAPAWGVQSEFRWTQ
ncbi:MAG: hypothetical protein IMX02_07995 [Limnochordaceae bacterium]|uniref:Spore coat protein n=1 Tax=Carboxydichorda subterranea TaxID=3109565 RepID=A0ABZ1BZ51_9FIRM|nr:hypothetical protein [Limnochorda sp. L945t]MBE3598724.1 hypothetical protein [Limnochordaceae bacterium]WRP18004.1 hypothetical protein U7230_03070 [Limnochorda sp. L945t]